MIEEIEKIDIRCPKCNKLIAKMRKNGICKNVLLYCKQCKKEYEISIMDNKEYMSQRAKFFK